MLSPHRSFTSRPSPPFPSSPPPSSSLYATSTSAINLRLLGSGSASPPTIIPNTALETVVETTDEWISSRTGISQRKVLTNDSPIGISTLGSEAAMKALEMANIDPSQVDMVIMCTSSPDDLFGDASTVANAIGASKAVAFDLTAACSGFLFGCVTAGQFLTNNKMTAVVVGADALTRWVDWDDRNSCILFGDGAGAVVLQSDELNSKPNNLPGMLSYSIHSDGSGHEDLLCKYAGEDREVATKPEKTIMSKGGYGFITMNGKEVYKFATRVVPTVLDESLEAAGITVDDVDHLLLHQANIRIMEQVAKRMNIPMSKVISNLKDYGNTSAGSIPIALDEAVRDGTVKKGDVIACAGFGAGLSWGSAIFRWG